MFKVGDRVRIKENSLTYFAYVGKTGTIVAGEDEAYIIEIDDEGRNRRFHFSCRQLEYLNGLERAVEKLVK